MILVAAAAACLSDKCHNAQFSGIECVACTQLWKNPVDDAAPARNLWPIEGHTETIEKQRQTERVDALAISFGCISTLDDCMYSDGAQRCGNLLQIVDLHLRNGSDLPGICRTPRSRLTRASD